MPFSIVEFKLTKDLEVVPSCWLRSGKLTNQVMCSWPDHLNKAPSKLKRFIRNSQPLTAENSKAYEVKILKTFDDLEKAKGQLKKLINNSQSSSKSLGRGKRKKYNTILSSIEHETSDSDDNCQSLPILRKRKRMISSTENEASDSDRTSLSILPDFCNQLGGYMPIEADQSLSSIKTSSLFSEDIVEDTFNETIKKTNVRIVQSSLPREKYDSNEGNKTKTSKIVQNIMKTGNRVSTPSISNEDLHKNQLIIIERLNALQDSINKINCGKLEISKPNNLPINLPVTDIDQFYALNVYLTDPQNFKQMVTFMKTYKSLDKKTYVYEVTKHLLADEMLKQINFTGKHKKIKLAGSYIEKLIYYTIKSSEGIEIEDYKKYLSNYIKYAPQRQRASKNNFVEKENTFLNYLKT